MPVDKDYVGITANYFAPYIKQLVVGASDELAQDPDAFERKLYVIRRVAELAAGPELVIATLSSRTIAYKGMLTAPQLLGYYPDLSDQRTKTALALVHSRFSTNTFPSWELAHPYRMIAHNGEINTLRGNVNWMRARESQLASELFGEDDLRKILPDRAPGRVGLRDLRQRARAARARRPLAAARDDDDDPGGLRGPRRTSRRSSRASTLPLLSHGAVGRAGRGGVHRRPRHRRDPGPQRAAPGPLAARRRTAGSCWAPRPACSTSRPRTSCARAGCSRASSSSSTSTRGASSPTRRSRRTSSPRRLTAKWYEEGVVHLSDLPERAPRVPRTEPLRARQLAFGYTQEDLRVLLAPIAAKGKEPIGSMGNDAALAVLSDRRRRCSATSSSSSPRSPTRRSTRSARRSS